MTWKDFKKSVDQLLLIDRRRLGAQEFIDQQILVAVGDIQRLIDYYRRGITSTFEHDDVARDGFASKLELPAGANLQQIFHVRSGNSIAKRPLYEYPFTNRFDLVAGVVGLDSRTNSFFRYSIDYRDGAKSMWVYPMITDGYSIQVVWDAISGRNDFDYKDTDEVPFDRPFQNLVFLYVKMMLARDVNGNAVAFKSYSDSYRLAIASLYSEVQDRLRLKRAEAEASCRPCASPASEVFGATQLIGSACESPVMGAITTSGCTIPKKPEIEWVMFGDSGDTTTIQDTIAVATGVKAINPDFIVHLGDAAYGTGGQIGGAMPLLRDLFEKHYHNFLQQGRMYLAFGNHDLESYYGDNLFSVVPSICGLVGNGRPNHKLWYEFAKGDVRFFVLNSGSSDSDSNLFLDEQKDWLRHRVCAAKEKWLVAVHHRPQYTSDANYHPGSSVMRTLNLHTLGIDLVVSAHGHNYERVLDPYGLMHVVCGLGGAPRRAKAVSGLPSGSQFFYNSQPGFLHFTASEDAMQFTLMGVDGKPIDRVTLEKSTPRVVECYGYA